MAASNRGGTENLMTAIEQVSNNYTFRDNENNAQVKNLIFVTNEDADDKNGDSDNDGINNTDEVKNILTSYGIVAHGIYNQSISNSGIEEIIAAGSGKNININDSNWGNQLNLDLGQSIGESGLVDESEDMPVLNIQTGPNPNQNLKLDLEDMRNFKTGLKFIDINSQSKAEKAISKMDEIIAKISDVRSKYGAYQNKLKHCRNNVSNYKENIKAAHSRIKDLDLAKEISQLTRSQILQQAGRQCLLILSLLTQIYWIY